MELVPRGAVYDPKTGASSLDDGALKQHEAQMREWKQAADQEASATTKANREFEKIKDYIRVLEGGHWPKGRPDYRSSFVLNRIERIRQEHLALLTDIRPTIEVISKVEAYQKQAEIARRVIEYEWFNNDLDLSLVSVVDHALFGAGYWKVGAAMPGVMKFVPCGMDVVIPLQPGLNIQDSAGVLYKTFKPLGFFQRAYPRKFAAIEKSSYSDASSIGSTFLQRPGYMDEYTWNALAPQLKWKIGLRSSSPYAQGGVDGKFFRGARLQEYWVDDTSRNETRDVLLVKDPNLTTEQHNYWYLVRPGERMYPHKRLIIYANDVLVYDGPSPYWHGLYQ
jgi:hypothetical protein